jgi:hypothetical protein
MCIERNIVVGSRDHCCGGNATIHFMFLLHYLLNDTVFWGGGLLEIKFVFSFYLQILSKIFLIIRTMHIVVFRRVRVFSHQARVIFVRFK